MEKLHADIAAYLRDHRPDPTPDLPPEARVFCRECGGQIVAGDGRYDLALLYRGRRCEACYAGAYPEE